MQLRFATKDEKAAWDTLVQANPDGGNFLQGAVFAAIKQPTWAPHFLIAEYDAHKLAILALTRSVPFLGSVLYIPGGPGSADSDFFTTLMPALESFVKTHLKKVFVIKIEPPVAKNASLTYGVSAPDVQPASSIILPVSDSLETLGRRARRYIRVGEREGVIVKRTSLTEETMSRMYELMGSAFGGKGIPGRRTLAYYKKFWTAFEKAGQGELYFAYENKQPVAGVYVIKYGKKALYKDGGSLFGRTSKGATYLIHWAIMQALLKDGVTSYDLWGSPPSDKINDPEHPLHGLASFKTAFSNEVTDLMGVRDIPVIPARYTLWLKLFPLYRRYLLRVKKQGFY